MLKLVGLSGGPGNGKSAAAEFFRKEGICVIDADKVCHAIYAEKENGVLSALRERWGDGIFDAEGVLDRRKVARIVFEDAKERKFLDSLLHPEIFRRVEKILEKAEGPFAVLEAALLFETAWDKKVFRTVTVWAEDSVRMERLLTRNWTREEARKRIDSQMKDAEKLERADYAIINNGSLSLLYSQCAAVLAQLREETK